MPNYDLTLNDDEVQQITAEIQKTINACAQLGPGEAQTIAQAAVDTILREWAGARVYVHSQRLRRAAEIEQAALNALKHGATVEEAAAAAGVTARTVRRIRRRGVVFAGLAQP